MSKFLFYLGELRIKFSDCVDSRYYSINLKCVFH